MRYIRITLATFILLIFTAQTIPIEQNELQVRFGGLSNIAPTEQLLELLQLQEQLLYYYPNLENLAKKADGKAKALAEQLAEIQKKDLQILNQLEQAKRKSSNRLFEMLLNFVSEQENDIRVELDSLKGKNLALKPNQDALNAIYKIYRQKKMNSFLLEKDSFIGIDLYSLDSCSINESGSLYIIADILKRIKTHTSKEDILKSIDEGTISFADLLQDDMKDQWEKDKKTLENSSSSKNIGGPYNRILLLLREISPEIQDIVNEDENNIDCAVIAAYIDVQAANSRISVVRNFLKNNAQSTILNTLFSNTEEKRKFIQLLNKYNELTRLPSTMLQAHGKNISEELQEEIVEEVNEFKQKSAKPLFEARKNLLTQIDNIIELLLSVNMTGSVEDLKNYTDFLDANQTARELDSRVNQNVAQVSTKAYNFADPPQKDENEFWMRLTLDDETVKQIQLEGRSDGTNVSVSLVYRPKFSSQGKVISNNDTTGAFSEIAKQKEAVNKALNEVYTEIATGLTVHRVNIKKVKASEAKFILKLTDEKTGEEIEIPIDLEMPDIGIKTRFEYEREQFFQFVKQLQLSKTLGFRLNDIGINPETWEPTFYFDWKQDGLVAEMIRAKKELDEVKIALKQLNQFINDQDPKRAFQLFVVSSLADSLNAFANNPANQELMKNILMAEEIQSIRIYNQDEELAGEASILPWGTSVLDIRDPVDIQFKMVLDGDRSKLIVNAPRINIEEALRKKLEQELAPVLRSVDATLNAKQFSVASFNVLNLMCVENPTLNFREKNICGNISFDLGGEKPNAHICINQSGVDFSGLEALLNGALKSYIKKKLKELIVDQLKDKAVKALAGNVQSLEELCEKIKGETFSIFSYKAVVGTNCDIKSGYVTAEAYLASDQDTKLLTVRAERDGSIKIESVDGTILRTKLIAYVKQVLPDNEYIKIENPRFEGSDFLVDTRFEMSTLDMDLPLDILRITSDGQVSYEGNTNIEDQMLVVIGDVVKKKLNAHLDENPVEINFGKASGFSVDKVTKFQLTGTKLMELSASVQFPMPEGLPPIKTFITFNIPSLKPQLDLQSLEKQFAKILEPLSNLSFPDLCVKIENISPIFNPIGFSGDLNITIAGIFQMPSTRFYLTKDDFKFTLNPEFMIPAAIPIAPFVVIIDPTLKLDTEKKLLSGLTRITLGGADDARATENIARVNAQIDLSYENIGDIDYRGDLIVGSVIPMMKGTGKIRLKETRFEMMESTVGPIRELVEYDKEIVFDGEKRSAQGSAALNALGIASLEFTVKGEVFAGQFKIDGEGRGRIPLVDLKLAAGTMFQPMKPVSVLRNAYAYLSLSDKFGVADFRVSNLAIEADMYRARTSFEVMGAQLGLTVPVVTELDEDDILKLILSMFAFDPMTLINLMNDFDKIKLKNINFSKVSLPDNLKSNGVGFGGDGEKSEVKDETEQTQQARNADDGEITKSDVQSRDNTSISFENMAVRWIGYDSVYYTQHCWKEWYDVFEWGLKCEQIKHVIHKFNWPSWPTNFGSCLPDDYASYSCLYYSDEPYKSTEYKIQDIIAPIEYSAGNSKRIEVIGVENDYEFLFFRAKVDSIYPPVDIDGIRYVCLSDPNLTNSTGFCMEVPANFPAVDPNYYINIAYNDAGAYLFLSYDIQNPNCLGTDDKVDIRKLSLTEFKKEQLQTSASEVELIDAKVISLNQNGPNPQTTNKLSIDYSAISKAYIFNQSERNLDKRVSVFQENSGISFSAFLDQEREKKLSGIMQMRNSENTNNLKSFKEALSDSLEENFEELFTDKIFGRNMKFIEDQSMIVPFNNQLIILENKSKINLITRERTGSYDPNFVKNFLPKFTGKIWKSIDLNSLKNAIPQIPSGYANKASFDYIRNNYKGSIKINFDDFLNGILKFGEEPLMVKINLAPYEFSVYDLSKSSEDTDWGFEYKFDNSKKGRSNPYQLDTAKAYSITYSPLLEYLKVTDQSLIEHRDFLQDANNRSTHIYPNYFFYTMALNNRDESKTIDIGNLDNTALARIKQNELTFLKRDPTSQSDTYYKLIKLRPGNFNILNSVEKSATNPQVGDSVQLCFIDFILNGSPIDRLTNTLTDNQGFFDHIIDEIEAKETTKIYVDRVEVEPKNEDDYQAFRYRALIVKEDNVELFWEAVSDKIVDRRLIIDHKTFDDNFKTAVNGYLRGFNAKRISEKGNIPDIEKAKIVFKGLDGTETWFKGEKIRVNPLAIFNESFSLNLNN